MHTSQAACGNARHEPHCNCDVDVALSAHLVPRFRFAEVKGGDVVSRALKYRDGVGGASLADFLEAFSGGIEATAHLRGFDPDWLDGVFQSDLPQRIMDHLGAGESIVDAPDAVGDSFARIVAVLTRGHPTVVWTWGERQWIDFERALLRSPCVVFDLQREFGVTRNFVTQAAKFYGVELASDQKARRNERLRELLELDDTMTPQQYVDILGAEGDGEVGIWAVKKFRQRWRTAA